MKFRLFLFIFLIILMTDFQLNATKTNVILNNILSINFPSKPKKDKVKNSDRYILGDECITFAALIFDNEFNIIDKETLADSYSGFIDGFAKKGEKDSIVISDFSLNNYSGKYCKCQMNLPDGRKVIKELKIIILNNKTYGVSVAYLKQKSPEVKTKKDKFLNSMTFKQNVDFLQIRQISNLPKTAGSKNNNDAYKNSYQVGMIFGYATIALGVFLAIYFVRKDKK